MDYMTAVEQSPARVVITDIYQKLHPNATKHSAAVLGSLMLKRVIRKLGVSTCLDLAGLSLPYLFDRLKRLTAQTEVHRVVAANGTWDYIERDNQSAQSQALRIAFQLHEVLEQSQRSDPNRMSFAEWVAEANARERGESDDSD